MTRVPQACVTGCRVLAVTGRTREGNADNPWRWRRRAGGIDQEVDGRTGEEGGGKGTGLAGSMSINARSVAD